MKKYIEIYTDGSAIIAKKPGGFGWVIVVNGVKHSEGYGYISKADNNDAELEGALQGVNEVWKMLNLEVQSTTNLNLEYEITLFSDSQIVVTWASGLYHFKQSSKYKKYEKLKEMVTQLNVKTKWVRAHSGHVHNERCDELATYGRLRLNSK